MFVLELLTKKATPRKPEKRNTVIFKGVLTTLVRRHLETSQSQSEWGKRAQLVKRGNLVKVRCRDNAHEGIVVHVCTGSIVLAR